MISKSSPVVALRALASAGVLLLIGVTYPGCETQQGVSRKAMTSLMQSLKEAIERRNVNKMMTLCKNSPDFFVCTNGKVLNYDEFSQASRQAFQAIKSVQLTWDTLHVKVLGSDVVATMIPFHETLVDSNGVGRRLRGEMTWVASRMGGDWKFIYAHAWHEPDTDSR